MSWVSWSIWSLIKTYVWYNMTNVPSSCKYQLLGVGRSCQKQARKARRCDSYLQIWNYQSLIHWHKMISSKFCSSCWRFILWQGWCCNSLELDSPCLCVLLGEGQSVCLYMSLIVMMWRLICRSHSIWMEGGPALKVIIDGQLDTISIKVGSLSSICMYR